MCISWLQSSQLTIPCPPRVIEYCSEVKCTSWIIYESQYKDDFFLIWKWACFWKPSNQEQSSSTWWCMLASKWVWCFIGQVLLYQISQMLGLVGPGLHRGHRCYRSEQKYVLIAPASVQLNSYFCVIHVHLCFCRWKLFLSLTICALVWCFIRNMCR